MKIGLIIFMFLLTLNLNGRDIPLLDNDTLDINNNLVDKDTVKIGTKLFYDSLKVRANRYQITRWLYDWMIRNNNIVGNKEVKTSEYYKGYANKTIGSISIRSLDVFGPDLYDTSKVSSLWVEKMANKFHSKSNLNVIRKNLWVKEGQKLDPNLFMDNERLLRSLPYIKDVRFIISPRIGSEDVVDVLILTQDVFSLGVTGAIGNINSGEIGVFDKNIFGIGHEVGVKFVGHTDLLPHLGFETYYAINNVNGDFINFSTGYSNTYLKEDFFISIERDFLRPQSVYAGGLTAYRSFRSNTIYSDGDVTSTTPLNYLFMDGWYGRRLKLGINSKDSRFQTTLSGRIRYTSFSSRPLPDINQHQYFANSTFYLGSLSFSHRSYMRDHLVYSYGITEDIPKGYLHEVVFGYDKNEFGNRFYSHLFLSTGNMFKQKQFYFYSSLGLGSFWNKSGFEQGIVDVKMNFISPLVTFWNLPSRQFVKLNYTLGINRFDVENLLLLNSDGIRGFGSHIEKGKQRLTMNLENVFFQKKSILNFRTALFSFFDFGVVGPSNQSIFKQTFYSGIGVGLRIRNENLIFKTIQIRFAYYPNHPNDVSFFGFILDEVSKNSFYSFQPRGPEPLTFK
jgi:hypothetical protein